MSPILLFALLMSPVSADLPADAKAFSRSLRAARDAPGIPLSLDVECTHGSGRRSIEVIRDHVAVWNGALQVRLDEADRASLIDLLIDADFASFEERYGDVRKPEKLEAPLRVSCRVHAEVDGVEKTSVQLFDGEQSAELLGLARALIDVVEPKAGEGESARSIEDGLAKIAAGKLAPELLDLRWLGLPDTGNGQKGFIVRISRGRIEFQPYTPGEAIGETASSALTAGRLDLLIRAFEKAEFWRLPLNLRADGLNEIELTILDQERTVIARPTFKAATPGQQAAFADLPADLTDMAGLQ